MLRTDLVDFHCMYIFYICYHLKYFKYLLYWDAYYFFTWFKPVCLCCFCCKYFMLRTKTVISLVVDIYVIGKNMNLYFKTSLHKKIEITHNIKRIFDSADYFNFVLQMSNGYEQFRTVNSSLSCLLFSVRNILVKIKIKIHLLN